MLYGEYQHNMDLKGRVTVPSRLREELGDKFFVFKGADPCLYVLSEENWKQFIEKVAPKPVSQSKGLLRFFSPGCVEVVADNQGRILIP